MKRSTAREDAIATNKIDIYPTYGERYWDHDAGCELRIEAVDYKICGNRFWIAVQCKSAFGPVVFIGLAWEKACFTGDCRGCRKPQTESGLAR